MSSLVKVVVPCFGYADVLPGCVESVLEQRGVDVQLLIIDDCSPDETPEVAGRIARREDRVEYRRHEENEGLIAGANEGLRWAADSDYVLLLSADDLLVPGSLQRAVEVMGARPEVGMVYGRAPYFESGEPTPRVATRWRGTQVWPGAEWIRLRCRAGHNCISSPEVVVRTSVQAAVGEYNPKCRHASDLNMWLRIAAVSDVAYVKGAAQAIYRVHDDSMLRGMLGSHDGSMVDLLERRTAFEEFFAQADEAEIEVESLARTARRELARQAIWQASRATDRDDRDVPVDRLLAFALETYPAARGLREWRGMRLRRRIGAGRSQWFPPFLATGAIHRLRSHLHRLRWRLNGV